MKKLAFIVLVMMVMTSMMTGCVGDIQMPSMPDFSAIFGNGEETAEAGKPQQQRPASVEQKGGQVEIGSEHGKGAKGYVAAPGEAVIIMGVSTKKDVAVQLAGCNRSEGSGMSVDMYRMLNHQSRVKKVTIIGKNGPVTLDAKRIQMITFVYGSYMDVDAKKDLPVSSVKWMLM